MLDTWRRAPFLRILFPFLGGIALGDAIPSAVVIAFAAATAGAIGTWHLHRIHAPSYSQRYLPAVFLFLLFFALGALRHAAADPTLHNDHYSRQEGGSTVVLRLTGEAVRTASGYRCTAAVRALGDSAGWRSASGDVLLRIRSTDTTALLPKPDDVLIVPAAITEVPPPRNPGEFDYARYLAHKGITGQVRCADSLVVSLGMYEGSSWQGRFLRWRVFLIGVLYPEGTPTQEKEVLSALLFGKADGIDEETMQGYVASGTVHVLAVSGLHIGLVFALFAPLLYHARRRPRLRAWFFLVPLAILWAYAAVTGFSPSVRRAAVMCSFFLLSDNFGRENNGLNTLCASAFLLLMSDPSQLFDAGFQLSYTAVAGILTLQEPLRRAVWVRHPLLQKVWELTSVSIAAQIGVMPISLYLFHQFPVYFLLANLVLIPLSTLILYTGLLHLALCWWGPAAEALRWCCVQMTAGMNASATIAAELPGNLSTGWYPSAWQAMAAYFLLFAVARCIGWKERTWRLPALAGLAALLVLPRGGSPPDLWVMGCRGHSCLVQETGFVRTVHADSSLWNDAAERARWLDAAVSGDGTLQVFCWTKDPTDSLLMEVRCGRVEPLLALPARWTLRDVRACDWQPWKGHRMVMPASWSARRRKEVRTWLEGAGLHTSDLGEGALAWHHGRWMGYTEYRTFGGR